MKTPLYLKSVFAVCLFVLAAVHAHADENDEAELDTRYEDWFQIELIIFDRPSSQAAAQEAWRNNIAIEYPSKLDFLLTQELKGNGASRDIVINGGKVVDGNHQVRNHNRNHTQNHTQRYAFKHSTCRVVG